MSSNPRFRDALTPEARLAVVIVTFYKHFEMKNGHPPDYEEVELAIKPYLDTLAVEVRVDEAHLQTKNTQMERLRQLDRTLQGHIESLKAIRML